MAANVFGKLDTNYTNVQLCSEKEEFLEAVLMSCGSHYKYQHPLVHISIQVQIDCLKNKLIRTL